MNSNVIIGTAGHVDHGKTALIRALTGIETDRLKQEKERGITIELGFAWFDLPDGRRAGIIDVPGHERFVRNMLAGAAGIDVVLMVVAADEGVMPQTREHLNILQLLGVTGGIVVLTKADLVEKELLELAQAEVDEVLADTFLAGAPRVAVSAVTGEGLDELRTVIAQVAVAAPLRQRRSFARLPVDRVFVQKGFGTVVTGTLLDDVLTEGDQVMVMPGEIRARVRQLQVHSQQVKEAEPGQRVAVNLAGLERSQIHRGQVVFRGQELEAVDKVAARFSLLPGAPPLVNNTRIRFHCSASETIGRAVLLEGEQLEPGSDALVQFRLDQPVLAVRGDRYVVRSWSPVTTIGGGEIIQVGRKRLSRHKTQVVETLIQREKGDSASLVKSYLEEAPLPLTEQDLLRVSQLPIAELKSALDAIDDSVLKFTLDNQTWYFYPSPGFLDRLASILSQWHHSQPLRPGIPREELRSQLFPNLNARVFSALIELVMPLAGAEYRGQDIALGSHSSELSPELQALREKIIAAAREDLFSPPEVIELEQLGREAGQMLQLLVRQQQLVVTGGLVFSREAIERAATILSQHFLAHDQLTLAQFRDYLNTSRKFALPLIEYMDGAGFTRRRGDVRLPGPGLRGGDQ